MKQYIMPNIKKFNDFESLDEYVTSSSIYMNFSKEEKISFEQILQPGKTMIIAEPGMGKTFLLKEIVKRATSFGKNALYIEVKKFERELSKSEIENKISEGENNEVTGIFWTGRFEFNDNKNNIICIDALDELLPSKRASIIEGIKLILKEYPKMQVYCSCRKQHYKANLKDTFGNFTYRYIEAFTVDQVLEFLRARDSEGLEEIIMDIFKSKNKDMIIQTPRYLDMLIRILNEKKETIKYQEISRGKLFEKFIYMQLENELKINNQQQEMRQTKELVKRVLEKLALVMAIYQTNVIKKEELMSFFDGINSTLSIVFLSQIDFGLLYERSLLKDNLDRDETIQFENAEIQEYLAANEIVRMGHLEQTIFDLCVNDVLRTVYPAWHNTLKFLIEKKPMIAISMVQLLVQRSGRIQDEELHQTISSVNRNEISLAEREMVFNLIFRYYQDNEKALPGAIAVNLSKLYIPNRHSLVLGELTDPKLKNLSIVNQNNIAVISGEIMTKNPEEIEFWKKKIGCLDWNKHESIAIEVVYALGKIKDIEVVKKLGIEKLAFGKRMRSYLISACIEADLENKYSIKMFIDGIKNKEWLAKYGISKLKKNTSIRMILESLRKDREFLIRFIDDLKDFSDNGDSFLKNLFDVWDEKIEEDIILITQYMVLSDENWQYENVDFWKRLLKKAQEKNVNFIIKLTEKLMEKQGGNVYCLIRFLGYTLTKEVVGFFISTLSIFENGRDVALKTLVNMRFEFVDVYEAGREYFKSEYDEMDQTIKDEQLLDDKSERLYEIFKRKLGSEGTGYYTDVFSFYYQNRMDIKIKNEDKARLKQLIVTVLDEVEPKKHKLEINERTDNSMNYTTSNLIMIFGDCLMLIREFDIEVKKYRSKVVEYLPFADSEKLNAIFELLSDVSDEEANYLIAVYDGQREDGLAEYAPGNFVDVCAKFNEKKGAGIIKKMVENNSVSIYTRNKALKTLNDIEVAKDYTMEMFEKYKEGKYKDISVTANSILIDKYEDISAINWRIDELISRAFSYIRPEGTYTVGSRESELGTRNFATPIIRLSKPIYIENINKLIDAAFDVYDKGKEYHEYAYYLWKIVTEYYTNLKYLRSFSYLRKFINEIEGKYLNRGAFKSFSYSFSELKNDYLSYLGKPQSFEDCIKMYNRIKENKYIEVSNTSELLEVIVSVLENDVKRWIESEGAYSFIQKSTGMQEDLIQKTIVTQLENGLLKRGIRCAEIRREEQLLDNKRPDMLVSYGFIGPVLIEIKRADNREVHNPEERRKYRSKLLQYLKATRAEYGLFLLFQINDKFSVDEYVKELNITYKEDNNIIIKGYKCI